MYLEFHAGNTSIMVDRLYGWEQMRILTLYSYQSNHFSDSLPEKESYCMAEEDIKIFCLLARLGDCPSPRALACRDVEHEC